MSRVTNALNLICSLYSNKMCSYDVQNFTKDINN